MKLWSLCCFWTLAAAQQTHIALESTLFYESQALKGHNVIYGDTVVKRLEDDTQSLATWFNRISLTTRDDEERYALNVEAAANTHLAQEAFSTPLYIRKEGTQSAQGAMLTQGSLDLNFPWAALSFGRNRFETPWISGTIDGIIAHHTNDYADVRLFWFANYYDFAPNYRLSEEALADHQGVVGASVQTLRASERLRAEASYHRLFDTYDLSDLSISLSPLEPLGLTLAYTALRDLRADVDPVDEALLRYALAWFPVNGHTLMLGGSTTGKNGLRRMLQMGTQPFDLFVLGNQVHRREAQNRSLAYRYEGEAYWGSVLAGQSDYLGKKLERRSLVDARFDAREIDITIGMMLHSQLSFELSWALMDVDSEDLLEFDTSLLHVTLMAVWP
ncbi:MAG: hypothetical protein JXK05_07180 [Campylobacterales bacterium]|nr:hypothetical protein [Campylobacterales bacterium]